MRVGLVVFSHPDYWFDLGNALCEMGASVTWYLSEKYATMFVGNHAVDRMHHLGLVSPECNVRIFRLPRMRDPRNILVIHNIARTIEHDSIDVAHFW